MASTSILLQGGTVLTLSKDDKVIPLKNTDLLIQGDRIAKIGSNLAAPAGATIIDCKGNIVSPGFIDTHHHVWQSQLKGRHADELLMDYMVTGNQQSYSYTPKDIFWGELAGCLDAIDSGVTMLVDHAHMTYSPDHASNAISATVASGIRSYFCYCPILRLKKWTSDTFEQDYDFIPDWFMKQLEELAATQPFGDGRVRLGVAFDGLWMPEEAVKGFYEKVRKLGVKLITTHYGRTAIFGYNSTPELLSGYKLLDSDILLSHANGASEKDAQLLTSAGAYISSTPDTELQMGLGMAMAFRPEFKNISSFGIDCQANNRSSILTQMHLGLQTARGAYNQKFVDNGLQPLKLRDTVEDAFKIGTIQGARAVNMEDQIGSLAEGKLADIAIFNGMSPGMVCASEHDPVAAIVSHASTQDIEMVIVNGVIRKEQGLLSTTTVDPGLSSIGKSSLDWNEIATGLVKSRSEIQARIDKLGLEVGRKSLIQAFHIDESKFVSEV